MVGVSRLLEDPRGPQEAADVKYPRASQGLLPDVGSLATRFGTRVDAGLLISIDASIVAPGKAQVNQLPAVIEVAHPVL
jgi:hypothetical protein